MRNIIQSQKLAGVRYDVRGPILHEAERLEAAGEEILRLNLGNPATFGFEALPEIDEALIAHLKDARGYSDSRGVLPAREAVAQHYAEHGIAVDPANVTLGNGVSELIALVLQALLSPGDEILIPAPDYPLWTAQSVLSGAAVVHYPCDENNGWMPDLDAIRELITPRTKALVMINPNNPTGAVYSEDMVREFAQIANEHGLVLLSDEIYEQVLYDGAVHHHAAKYVTDTLCITFGGLSKSHQLAGYRIGWIAITGNLDCAHDYLEGLHLVSNMRLCSNVPGQWVLPTALSSDTGIKALCAPGGRFYEQRTLGHKLLTEIPGVSCVMPQGAMYLFPRVDPDMYRINGDDQKFVIELLRETKVLITNGTGFNLPTHDHVRFVTLPEVGVIEDAIGRIADFLAARRA